MVVSQFTALPYLGMLRAYRLPHPIPYTLSACWSHLVCQTEQTWSVRELDRMMAPSEHLAEWSLSLVW